MRESAAMIDWSDDQLMETARTLALRVDPTYSAVMAELDRRASNRAARTSRVLSVVSLAIALAALVVTALKA